MGYFIRKRGELDTHINKKDLPQLSASQELFLTSWLDHCSDQPSNIPARSAFPPDRYAKHMSSVVIFSIQTNPLDFRYDLFGTTVRYHSNADFTGKLISSLPGKGSGSQIWNMLDQTRTQKIPFYREVPYVGPHADIKRSTVLFLPMADDNKTPDRIFLVTNFVMKDQ